jgi:hypothetical protein
MDLDHDAARATESLESVPEILLPTQMDLGGQFAVALGERRLLWAMLLDAVVCVRKYHRARDNNGRKLFREAERWICSRDDAFPFSFPTVCDVLGLNAQQVRVTLLECVYGKVGERARHSDENRRAGEWRPRQLCSAAGSRRAKRSGLSALRSHGAPLGDRGDSLAQALPGRR